jgi:hypothetical protein
MIVDEAELRAAVLDWINNYCNQEFEEATMPAGVKLAFNIMLKSATRPADISSQSAGGLSISYFAGGVYAPTSSVIRCLTPYVKMKVL